MASETFVQSFETGFADELQKIAAKRVRVNAHKKSNYTTTRKGRRPIRADKLKESAPTAVADTALDLLKNKLLMGLLAGGTAGVVGHQGHQDWKLGRQVRKAQTRR